MSDIPPLSFEDVFRFKEPTPEQIQAAADALSFKFNNDGQPIGTQAFFSVPALQDASMEYITSLSRQSAEEHGITREDAFLIVFSGFIGALELIATLRQRAED